MRFLRLTELNMKEFIQSLSSPDPTPGGGSASALCGALGASLLRMVSGITLKKVDDGALRNEFNQYIADLDSIRDEFLLLIDEDAEAFDRVMGAFKLPKETEEEKKARKEAIQRAFKGAADVPMRTAKLAVRTSGLAVSIAERGEKNAISDVGCAVSFLRSAFDGAIYNVNINLGAIKDDSFVKRCRAEIEELSDDIDDKLSEAKRAVGEYLE